MIHYQKRGGYFGDELKVLWFIVLIILGYKGVSQHVFTRIQSDNNTIVRGLSQNSVHAVLQDKYHFMWFGTWDGLNCYDGYSFSRFDKEMNLSSQTIISLFEDSDGKLWVGTDNGLNCYDRKENSFITYKYDAGDEYSLPDNRINCFYQTVSGDLYIGTGGGLCKYDAVLNRFIRFIDGGLTGSRLRNNCINAIAEDSEGYLWLGSSYGLILFDPVTLRLIRFYHTPGNERSIADNKVNALMFENDSLLWVGTRGGLSLFSIPGFTARHPKSYWGMEVDFSGKNISVLFRDSQNKVWIGTEGDGLFYFDSKTEHFEWIKHRIDQPFSLASNQVLSIAEDCTGTIWIGTFKGVCRENVYSGKFRQYIQISRDRNSLNDNYVLSFAAHEEDIWMATRRGVSILNRRTGKFRHMNHEPGNIHSVSNDRIRAIVIDSCDRAWIASDNHGLDEYDITSGLMKHYRYEPENKASLPDNQVVGLLLDDRNKLWVATAEGGICCYDEEGKGFRRYRHVPEDRSSISGNRVISISKDSQGMLWVASDGGLDRFDPYNGRVATLATIRLLQRRLENKEVYCLVQDRLGIYWIGTRGDGLFRFDINRGDITQYMTRDGLPNNVVYGIVEDEIGKLWISTNNGLARFDKNHQTFLHYDVSDGIQSSEFNYGAFLRTEDGEIFFGGMNGVNAFYPSEIISNREIPLVAITSFKVFNQVKVHHPQDGDTIILSYDDNFFTFEFAALDFVNPVKNQYSYFLENFDATWNHSSADRRFAEYTRVSPGIYHFHVIGSNNDGVWNEKGASVTLIITPPWYDRWYYNLAALLLIVLLIVSIIYLRIRRLRKKHSLETRMLTIEKQKLDIEQQALRLQMNPHFIFNSMNSIQSFVVDNDTDKAIFYLAKFSRLMRMILAHSREETVPVQDEMAALGIYMDLERLRFDDKFEYKVVVDQDIDEEFIEIPPMIIQPYVENAILHGLVNKKGPGNLLIHLSLEGETIRCVIEDDGIGREAAEKIRLTSDLRRKSRGMLITKERLELMNRGWGNWLAVQVEDLFDEDGGAAGTRVILHIVFREA